MIIILKKGTEKKKIDDILEKIKDLGLKPLYMPGTEKVVLGALGDERKIASLNLDNLPIVEKIIPILSPYKLASRELYPTETIVDIEGHLIGAPNFTVIAGPCSVENEKQIMTTAAEIKKNSVHFLRGGAFKPRSSPYSFQGLGKEGLKLLFKAKKKYGIIIVTELLSCEDTELLCKYADVLQIGARNMQNFRLLEKAGKSGKPVLLKRGMSATINDLLMSAEYILNEGNKNVILCERGIRTFETSYRSTLDLTAIPILKKKTHLPVIVDPSHAAGNREYIIQLSKAAMACGADGIIVEIHPEPEKALSDAKQSLYFNQFEDLMNQLRGLAELEGKVM